MKINKLLKETTDNKIYKIAHKRKYGRCWICPYHGDFWARCSDVRWRQHYYYEDDGTSKPYAQRFRNHPNWKLVSKNKKQWMRKKFVCRYTRLKNGNVYMELGWN